MLTRNAVRSAPSAAMPPATIRAVVNPAAKLPRETSINPARAVDATSSTAPAMPPEMIRETTN